MVVTRAEVRTVSLTRQIWIKMATSSCSVFLKRPHEAGRTELCIEDVREFTVQELMDKVAEKMNVPTKEFREFLF